MMPCCRQIVAAFDGDRGGFSAAYDVCEAFSELGPVRVYELDDCKDPNELLQARRRQESRELSATEKLSLYREFTAATNKSSVVRKWGLSRSYVYAVVGECEKAIVDGFASRRRGRPGRNESGDLAAERQRIADLERRVEEESREREKLYCRSEFLQLRLKWAEIEAAEARGEKADGCGNVVAKRQAKKKRKKKR
jgi:DNA primase